MIWLRSNGVVRLGKPSYAQTPLLIIKVFIIDKRFFYFPIYTTSVL
jgi:hypothetical protein